VPPYSFRNSGAIKRIYIRVTVWIIRVVGIIRVIRVTWEEPTTTMKSTAEAPTETTMETTESIRYH
jgi:hypothetical protein